MPFLRGRNFADADRLTQAQLNDPSAPRSPGSAVINSAFASRYFPKEDPIGRTLVLFDDQTFSGTRTIVGIVADVRERATADGFRIAQFRQDGFTLNNVGSYMGGDALLSEAITLWSAYAGVARPPEIVRLALRYLNRLILPLRVGEDFNRFLRAAPELPPEAPQAFSSFLSRVVAHEAERRVVVTQNLERMDSTSATVLIDVDAIMDGTWSPTADDLMPSLNSWGHSRIACSFPCLHLNC